MANLSLLSAIDRDDAAGVRKALKSGAKLNAVFPNEERVIPSLRGSTPLIYAIKTRKNNALGEIIAQHVQRNVSLSGKGLTGLTPLAHAIAPANDFALAALISAKADLNERGDYGLPPIIHAVLEGNSFALDALIDAGARIDEPSEDGYTAYHLAKRIGSAGPAGCDKRTIFADRLRRAGADTSLLPPMSFIIPSSDTPFSSPAYRRSEWIRRRLALGSTPSGLKP